MWRLLLYVWVGPGSLIGLVAAGVALVSGGGARVVEGVLEVHGGWIGRWLKHWRIAAMTLGHVVIATSEAAHALSRSHERVHVRQYERWGPFFLPAYGLASLLARARGGHYYYDNAFEREAYGTTAGPPPKQSHPQHGPRVGESSDQGTRPRGEGTNWG